MEAVHILGLNDSMMMLCFISWYATTSGSKGSGRLATKGSRRSHKGSGNMSGVLKEVVLKGQVLHRVLVGKGGFSNFEKQKFLRRLHTYI